MSLALDILSWGAAWLLVALVLGVVVGRAIWGGTALDAWEFDDDDEEDRRAV